MPTSATRWMAGLRDGAIRVPIDSVEPSNKAARDALFGRPGEQGRSCGQLFEAPIQSLDAHDIYITRDRVAVAANEAVRIDRLAFFG